MTEISDLSPHSEYHRFVGAFITGYAQLELVLRWVVRYASGLTPDHFELLVGFPRAGDLRQLAKKLAKTADLKPNERNKVDAAFEWLSTITLLRDRIVHYGGTLATINDKPDQVILYNKLPIVDPMKNSTTIRNLWNAVNDPHEITNIFSKILMFKDIPEVGVITLRIGPWLYKPMQPL